ncbi:MAG TPA: hypothetical protein DCS97_02060 [Planctomycetes bacterium]|nr:hypothetical protein [Planctomycetota bacterium]
MTSAAPPQVSASRHRQPAWSIIGHAGLRGSLVGAMILMELLRGKHEGLNRGNGDPPIQV